MSEYIRKSHNVSVLYHLVCPAKYRRVVFSQEVDECLKDVCLEIAKRYEIQFIEIGTDNDHVHFLVQSVPTYSPAQVVRIIKSLTAREIFKQVPSVKKRLWGGEFWTKGYFVNTVGQKGNEQTIANYVRNQGREAEYQQLHREQLVLFDTP
ncbi:IS200/IS605 family transposase [uncultured Desulfuromonas sp.]|uniref:IS200/IS605 family transposase n=1 Tax=uncultured Desulfuromonas sp. TaxID=181013 RepID=UPI002AABD6BB|nr:IS200/IS605 family transposase [uncultured Desulfuromonas sp.]